MHKGGAAVLKRGNAVVMRLAAFKARVKLRHAKNIAPHRQAHHEPDRQARRIRPRLRKLSGNVLLLFTNDYVCIAYCVQPAFPCVVLLLWLLYLRKLSTAPNCAVSQTVLASLIAGILSPCLHGSNGVTPTALFLVS